MSEAHLTCSMDLPDWETFLAARPRDERVLAAIPEHRAIIGKLLASGMYDHRINELFAIKDALGAVLAAIDTIPSELSWYTLRPGYEWPCLYQRVSLTYYYVLDGMVHGPLRSAALNRAKNMSDLVEALQREGIYRVTFADLADMAE